MAKSNGKIALVTGASSGIGEATVERLAKAAYKVYGISRRGAQTGERPFQILPLDVTNDDALSEVVRRDGRIDLLVKQCGLRSRRREAKPAQLVPCGEHVTLW